MTFKIWSHIFLTKIAITWVLQLYFFYQKFCKILISKETKALLLRNHHALGHLFRHPAVVSERPRCAQHVEQVAELVPREARELRNSFPELFGLRRSHGPAMGAQGQWGSEEVPFAINFGTASPGYRERILLTHRFTKANHRNTNTPITPVELYGLTSNLPWRRSTKWALVQLDDWSWD